MADELLTAGKIAKALEVSPGEATSDLTFSLETVACFGACALAPVVVIDEQVHRQQTTTSLKKVVQDIRGQDRTGQRGLRRGASARTTKGKSRQAQAKRARRGK